MSRQADDVVTLTYDEAVALLPSGAGDVHTFLDAGFALVGAHWPRGKILDLLRTGAPELSGEQATGHAARPRRVPRW